MICESGNHGAKGAVESNLVYFHNCSDGILNYGELSLNSLAAELRVLNPTVEFYNHIQKLENAELSNADRSLANFLVIYLAAIKSE